MRTVRDMTTALLVLIFGCLAAEYRQPYLNRCRGNVQEAAILWVLCPLHRAGDGGKRNVCMMARRAMAPLASGYPSICFGVGSPCVQLRLARVLTHLLHGPCAVKRGKGRTREELVAGHEDLDHQAGKGVSLANRTDVLSAPCRSLRCLCSDHMAGWLSRWANSALARRLEIVKRKRSRRHHHE